MSAPQIAEEDDEQSPDEGGDGVDEDPEPPESGGEDPEESIEDEDVEMVSTSVSESGADPEGFFDDVEEESGNAEPDDSIFDGVEEGESDTEDSPEPASTDTTGLAQDINAGAARLSVVGLEDEWVKDSGETVTKSDLESEFKEVFEAARLGHYGKKVADEYLLVQADDIHPVWGLCGAMLLCAAVVVFRRPDGDQLIDTTKTKLGQAELSNLGQSMSNVTG